MQLVINKIQENLAQECAVPSLPKIKLAYRAKKRLHEGKVLPRKALPIDESELPLCVLMWQSTIVQAFYDLANDTKNQDAKLLRAEASSWFFASKPIEGTGQSDFDLVCDLACLSKSKVQKMARKILKEGEKALEGFNFRTIRKDFSDRAPTTRKKGA